MMDIPQLRTRIKHLIVECLQIEGLDPTEITDDQAIFGEGLGLDSVDGASVEYSDRPIRNTNSDPRRQFAVQRHGHR